MTVAPVSALNQINAQPPTLSSPIKSLLTERDFEKHQAAAEKMGFSLFIKRARIGTSKHIRVRPKFDNWSIRGELVVQDDQISEDVLQDILDTAGTYKGLGDWRPSSRKPGIFGTFTATVSESRAAA